MSFSSLEPIRHRTKVQALSAQITNIARETGPDVKLPTVLKLCEMLSVSVTTLNSALADLESQKVIYRRHGVGIFVSPHLGQKAVGLVCAPDFFRAGTSPFWQELIEGVQGRVNCKAEVFRFYLALASGRPDMPVNHDLEDDVAAKRLHGVFFIGDNLPAVEWLQKQGVPVVVFAGQGQWTVRIDYDQIVDRAVDVLVQNGCTHLALLSPGEAHGRAAPASTALDVSRAFEKALAARKLPLHDRWVWDVANPQIPFAETHQEQGFAGVMQIFDPPNGPAPDGLVIVDDMMTRGALVAMQKLGLKPGADVQIASHLNRGSAILHGYESDLHLIQMDPADVVRAMFETLETLMSGQQPENSTIFVGPVVASN